MSDTTTQIVDSMRDRLAAFTPGPDGRALDRLVGHLSGAIDGLVGLVDDQWLSELRSLWWPLEYVNANALGDDRDSLSEMEIESVDAGCSELAAFLEHY